LPLKQCCLPQAAAMAAMEADMAQARAGSDGERHANEDFGSLRSDMEAMRKDFGTLISTLKSDVSGRAGAERAQEQAASRGGRDVREDFDSLRSGMDALRKDFGTLVGALKSNVSSRADDLQTMGRQQLRSVEGKVEARPLLSLGIIFAMALVLGRLLYRR
jgi:ElaB/YqjD/DUF883 family membrane-anchored ribosome-binding protein